MPVRDDELIGAAGRFAPVRIYDAVVAATMREQRWRPQLATDLAGRVRRDAAVTEVGAGTGSLTRVLRGALPGATITAVEPDDAAVAIAAAKPGATDAGIRWTSGRAEALPLADSSQDAVVTALMLHHLAPAAKRGALAEARRVLRPGGLLYVADFGRPHDPLMSAAFALIQLADGRTSTAAHRAGAVPGLIAAAGFAAPERLLRLRTVGGTLELLRARAPGG